MCGIDVKMYKSKSHVIPKCLIKNLKTNGKMIHIDEDKVMSKYISNEIIDDFICNNCEDKTREDDKFAKEFFIDKKYLNSNDSIIEKYNPECFKRFKYFIFSIILRDYCYKRVIKNYKFIDERDLNVIRDIYLNKDSFKLLKTYDISIWKENCLKNTTFYPVYLKNENELDTRVLAIDILILGYRILVYKDEFFNSYKKNQVTATCFECHVINGRTPLLDDIIRGFNNYPKEGKLASDFQQIIINYIR